MLLLSMQTQFGMETNFQAVTLPIKLPMTELDFNLTKHVVEQILV